MIKKIIDNLKENWSEPKHGTHNGQITYFRLACEFSEEGVKAFNDEKLENVPEDFLAFWTITKSAKLFVDVEYGQWGLELFSPEDSIKITREERKIRPNDVLSTDLIIGRFLGDSELLLISGTNDSVEITIGLPIDLRNDWPIISKSFSNFLLEFVNNEGAKYWE